MAKETLDMVAVGDIILGPNPEPYFDGVLPTLQQAAVAVGQLEVPHTERDAEAVRWDRTPDRLAILREVDFDVLTLAGNHIYDAGVVGIEDTLAALQEYELPAVGAGMNLDEARSPLVLERGGTRFGFLNYNCVGPKETWASRDKPGCAYVHIITHYELDHATPGGPPTIYTWAEPETTGMMVEDIKKLRSRCDVLVVSFHKGIAHTPVALAAYEHQISHAAIDAGADLVLGHHAHILKGIELYQGKAIFHGLCNFVTYLPLLAPRDDEDPHSWASRRRKLFGFEPDPEYPTYPFHPEAIYTIIARCTVEEKQIAEIRFIPCLIDKQGHPQITGHDARGQEIFNYMEKITRKAGLTATFDWKGDEIVVCPGEPAAE